MLGEFQPAGKGVWPQGRLIHLLQRTRLTSDLLDYFFKNLLHLFSRDLIGTFLASSPQGQTVHWVLTVLGAHTLQHSSHCTRLSFQTVL